MIKQALTLITLALISTGAFAEYTVKIPLENIVFKNEPAEPVEPEEPEEPEDNPLFTYTYYLDYLSGCQVAKEEEPFGTPHFVQNFCDGSDFYMTLPSQPNIANVKRIQYGSASCQSDFYDTGTALIGLYCPAGAILVPSSAYGSSVTLKFYDN